ncbi:hypothetical protein Kpho02_56790 [Kitasatospora phosalacinea]|uniref:Uncharacterized protein n=1 Tax=Kitasatospora phosalacinea TaxID=2065 RepID=A0A9W6QAE9_9ACTN|nr:DUF6643 family protein [Kitasatospora phosalacinea]GLW73380.1 hypothetical protein Kpho02_56790 [Kitasatospora phosalacinea]
MTSPRSYDGVGYPSPSFSSGTPIYDSLVAERGIPQIAPINVPPALPASSWSSAYGSGFGTGLDSPQSNLPALPPARLALGPGPSSAPAPTPYIPTQPGYANAPVPPQPTYAGAPQGFLPGQRPAAPFQPQPAQAYQAPQAPAGGYAAAPQSFAPSFQAQQFGAQPVQQQQSFGDQSFGGNTLRPAAAPQQYPQYRQYPQAG